VQELLDNLPAIWTDYLPLLRLGQLPTAALVPEAIGQLSFQQVSPADGGAAQGTGNQNYGFRADYGLTPALMASAYFTYADDPLYTPITSRPTQPANLWTVYGGSLRARLAGNDTSNGAGSWALAAEAALELFSVGSGCGGTVSCEDAGTPNIFNNSGQAVFTRNWVGALSLPLSWQANRNLQLSFVPAVSFLPGRQGEDQGGAGDFYGTNISLGLGANYRLGNQVQLFSSAMLPLGPGNNAFNLIYPLYQQPKFNALSAYSIPLEWLVEAGLPGLITGAGLFLTAMGTGLRQWRAEGPLVLPSLAAVAAFAGLAIQGLTDTIFFRPEVQLIALFSLATLAASRRGAGATCRSLESGPLDPRRP
jgi:hypothetical protein